MTACRCRVVAGSRGFGDDGLTASSMLWVILLRGLGLHLSTSDHRSQPPPKTLAAAMPKISVLSPQARKKEVKARSRKRKEERARKDAYIKELECLDPCDIYMSDFEVEDPPAAAVPTVQLVVQSRMPAVPTLMPAMPALKPAVVTVSIKLPNLAEHGDYYGNWDDSD